MLVKSSAIDRLIRENPMLRERRFGLPDIGRRLDGESFNPTVQEIADAIDFYGYEVRDDKIADVPDINLGTGNPMKCNPFPLAIKSMVDALQNNPMYFYPYTEGDDNLRKILLDYVEQEGIINTMPYEYEDVDEKGLSVHNITFLPSTSIAFNLIMNIISKPGDVILVTGPNYGLFTIRAERAGAEVEYLALDKDDNWLVNPKKLASRIDEINESLEQVYNRRKGYVPRVVAFLNMNPHNPLGTVMGEKETKLLTQISQICLDRGVFVIDDLVYRDITFDENNLAKPIASIPGMFRNTISLFGLSKSYGMASLRAGFVVADEVIIRELINRIFQTFDSSPDIVGRALVGAYNTTDERKKIYKEYFGDIRSAYIYRYDLLKVLVNGIDEIQDVETKTKLINLIEENTNDEVEAKKLLKGTPYVKFPKNWEAKAGFFAVLDFTEIKGKKFQGKIIETEKDLLKFFYKTARLRFLIGQSIVWPYKDELIGRISFGLEENYLINAFILIHKSIEKLEDSKFLKVRKNILEDQETMAHIKVDGWNAAYKGIIADDYLASLDYKEQKGRYIASFDEYKDYVLVALNESDEVLAFSCFDLDPHYKNFDSEIVSLYVKPEIKGQGVGQFLFRATAKHLRNQGRKSMFLWCLVDNKPSIKFYEKMGGKICAFKEAKIGDTFYKEVAFKFDLKDID